jgi:hypothetical protein
MVERNDVLIVANFEAISHTTPSKKDVEYSIQSDIIRNR